MAYPAFAQNAIYVEAKAAFDQGDPAKYIYSASHSIATFTSDSKYMGISILRNKNTRTLYNMRYFGMLIDLENGELLKTYKNAELHIDGDEIIVSHYGDIWDEFVPIAEKLTAKSPVRLDPLTLTTSEVSKRLALPPGHKPLQEQYGYRLSLKDGVSNTTHVWKATGGKPEFVNKFPIYGAKISTDGTRISGVRHVKRKNVIEIYDIDSGKRLHGVPMDNITDGTLHYLTRDGRLIYLTAKGDLIVHDAATGRVVKSISGLIEGMATFDVDTYEKTVVMSVPLQGKVYFIDLADYSVITRAKYALAVPAIELSAAGIVARIGNSNNFLMVGGSDGISHIVNSESRSVVADIYVDQEGDWAVVSRDGRVDGSPGAMDKLEWREYDSRGRVVNTTSLSTAFTNFFTPSLLPSILRNEVSDSTGLYTQLAQAPKVSIDSPLTGFSTDKNEVSITVSATAEGDAIKAINIYVNSKLVADDTRGVSIEATGNKRTVTLALAPGKNVISARAISAKDFESALAQIEVTSTQGQLTSKLFLMAVGIDEYANSAYNLNYAVADAGAIATDIKKRANGIFSSVEVHTLYNKQATAENFRSMFADIQAKSRPDDVFVFFYAGHGVMSEADPDFYLALHNVTQLYGKDEMLALEGVSARTLRGLAAAIPAQKQMILLDACQSGGAVQTFAMRGAAEEKAIIQLARSTGVTLLASTGSEQFATEFKELGHGVFTYALLSGLNGGADGGSRDSKITVKELEAYLNDQVPELTQRHKGAVQYPRSWSQGMDFPISVVN